MSNTSVKVEVIVLPVLNLAAATAFYERLGWRQDRTPPGVVQFTPPGSSCSIQFGEGLTAAAPGSARLYLTVFDIAAVIEEVEGRGIELTETFHEDPVGREPGLDSHRRS